MTTLNIADYKTENWSVSRSITDALWTLTAQLDKHATPAFFTKIKAVAKDHGGNDRTPFVGIFPGSDYTMAPVGDKATLTGYDYAWYLTTQYVPAADRTTLIGTDPAETVRTLLGGDVNWATVTGVKPFRMIADSAWGTRQKVFEFDEKCTRWQAIQEIAEYCNYVFVVKPYYDSGDWYSYAYFIPEANIDNASPAGLDLPAMQTFAKPDAYLLPGTAIRDNPEKGFNRVKVTGYDETTQTYYYHTSETAEVGATPPTELAIEYFYASKDLNTQLKVNTRADELLAYFQASSKVYTAKLKQRMDLELYQKVRFADYDKIEGTTGVPVGMRITRISYHHAAVDDYVEIEFAKDQDAQQLRRLTEAVNPDYVSGTLDIVDDDLYATGLIDPMGYRYLRTDKHVTIDQNLYTDLDVMEDHAIEFYESSTGNEWGYIRAFDGALYSGLILESLSAKNLHVRAGGDLKLYAAADMFFQDINNAEISLSDVITGGGAYLPLAGGTMTGNIDMGGLHILETKSLRGRSGNLALNFYGGDGTSSVVKMMYWSPGSQHLNMNTHTIANLGAPSATYDAVRVDADIRVPMLQIPLTTKGYLLVGKDLNVADALAPGTDTHVLTLDSTQTLGMKWAASGLAAYLPLAGGQMALNAIIDMHDGDITDVDKIQGTVGTPAKLEFMGTTAYRIYVDGITPYYTRYETVNAHEFDVNANQILYISPDGIYMATGKKITNLAAGTMASDAATVGQSVTNPLTGDLYVADYTIRDVSSINASEWSPGVDYFNIKSQSGVFTIATFAAVSDAGAGIVFNGYLDMEGHKVKDLAAGTNPSDAVRFDQLGAAYEHPSARQCTTGNWAWASITGKPAYTTRWPTWSEVTSKPSLYTQAEINTWRNGTTQTEMGRVHGVTSDIQTQLNARMLLSVYDPGSDGVVIPTAGGTGQSSYAKGDILYASATNTLTRLAHGTENQVLTMNATLVPVWAAGGGGAYLPLAGGTMTVGATIDMNSGRIDNLIRLDAAAATGVRSYNSAGVERGRLATTSYALQCIGAGIDMNGQDITDVSEIKGATDQPIYIKPQGTGILYLG